MTYNSRLIFFISLFAAFFAGVQAQNNTNSPYTRFGYGEISDNGAGKSKGMGGVALGLRSNISINPANPASYTAVDTMSFLFEFGVTGRLSNFQTSEVSATKFTGNIEYISLKFPITKYLGFSAGLLPYSFVGYNYSVPSTIDYNGIPLEYQATFSGKGGITQLYGGLAGKIGKYFSAGVNVAYRFGTIANSRNLPLHKASAIFYGSEQTSHLTVNDINLRYGLQFYTDINKKYTLTVGAILETKMRMGGKYSIENALKYSDGENDVTFLTDTISEKNGSKFQSPLVVGGGVSFGQKNKFLVAADALYENWSDANFFGVKDSLKDRLRVNLGGEYIPNAFSRNYLARMTYRLGANFSTGYWNVNGETQEAYGVSIGFGLPVRRSMVNIGVEYGQTGRASATQIAEQYFKFSINATFGEIWFFKRKIE